MIESTLHLTSPGFSIAGVQSLNNPMDQFTNVTLLYCFNFEIFLCIINYSLRIAYKRSYFQVQVSRKFKVRPDIMWSGEAWICSKDLKHYSALCWRKTIIAVSSHKWYFCMQ